MTKHEAQNLIQQIDELQALLEDRATYFRNDEKQAVKRYSDLYLDVDLALKQNGYTHTNPHRDLNSIWSYSKLNGLGKYEERRDYIRKLYSDILFDLGLKFAQVKDSVRWKKANDSLIDSVTPIKTQWLKAKNFIHSNLPDFENSIKESINSIESALKILLSEPKGTLGQLVKKAEIDPDIQRIITQAYGLVSNKDFVRHGGTQKQNLTKEDAEFFLDFAASSIVYLKAKLKDEPG